MQDGVWRLPDGKAYYEALLSNYTTTDMTAAQIHDLGLAEVARIHGEMQAIMKKVGFKGTLQQFFRASARPARNIIRPARPISPTSVANEGDGGAPARLLQHAAQGASAGEGGRSVPREIGGQGLLLFAVARRVAPRHLLCEPL